MSQILLNPSNWEHFLTGYHIVTWIYSRFGSSIQIRVESACHLTMVSARAFVILRMTNKSKVGNSIDDLTVELRLDQHWRPGKYASLYDLTGTPITMDDVMHNQRIVTSLISSVSHPPYPLPPRETKRLLVTFVLDSYVQQTLNGWFASGWVPSESCDLMIRTQFLEGVSYKIAPSNWQRSFLGLAGDL